MRLRMNDLGALIEKAKEDPAFHEVARGVEESGSHTWLEPDEKALLFGLGAFATGDGRIVEIGAFEGGSGSFLAGGIRRRGRGRLHSVDPHLGAPPWFGLAPHKRTLGAFQKCLAHCGLTEWVQTHLGDSGSVAAVWPGEPIDAILIDGDHSYLGALADFECWAPKVRPGGLILFDDVGGTKAELNELVEHLKALESISSLGAIGEIAAFRRTETSSWALLAELSAVLAARRVPRPWDLSWLHATGAPAHYRQTDDWPNVEIGEAYMVGFFARCGAGPYGYTTATPPAERAFLHAISHDRADGPIVRLDGWAERVRALAGCPTTGFRVLFCLPDEAPALASRLLDGGVLVARDPVEQVAGRRVVVRRGLLDAGLSGIGGDAGLYWGVRRPDHLSPNAVLHHAQQTAGPAPFYRPTPVTAATNSRTTTTANVQSAALTGVDIGAGGVLLR
jgi:predicted O-methyltransferase YrrM